MTTAATTQTNPAAPTPRIVNGFDLNVLEQAGAALAANPAMAQSTFRARTEWQGQSRRPKCLRRTRPRLLHHQHSTLRVNNHRIRLETTQMQERWSPSQQDTRPPRHKRPR